MTPDHLNLSWTEKSGRYRSKGNSSFHSSPRRNSTTVSLLKWTISRSYRRHEIRENPRIIPSALNIAHSTAQLRQQASSSRETSKFAQPQALSPIHSTAQPQPTLAYRLARRSACRALLCHCHSMSLGQEEVMDEKYLEDESRALATLAKFRASINKGVPQWEKR